MISACSKVGTVWIVILISDTDTDGDTDSDTDGDTDK